MNEDAPDKLTEGDRNALEALHAELSEPEQKIGKGLRNSVHSETADAPPMPDDLLEDVLSDLGVKQSATATSSEQSLLDRLLSVFRSNPVSLGVAAAAACVVVVIAVTMDAGRETNGLSGGTSGVRGGSETPVADAPIVILHELSDALRDAVTENFNEEHLRFPTTDAELRQLIEDSARRRVIVSGDTISTYPAGATEVSSETPLPEAADEAVDAIGALQQELP